MEHLIRRHVSTIMVTFINEPMCIRKTNDPNDKYSKRYNYKGHRHLFRDELEAFFAAARKAIYTENPDRVIKNAEGDYDPPTAEGMPDFHTYTMWYTNHGQPIGKLMKGYMPPVKPGGWSAAVNTGQKDLIMKTSFWKGIRKNGLYRTRTGTGIRTKLSVPRPIRYTGLVQGTEQYFRLGKSSQYHQAIATKLMTDSFRRRADIINHTAIHLLIDAWPSGWMKALVCCDRIPKPAYFAYMDALEPVRVNLYTPRRYAYDYEIIPVEAWLLNDTSKTVEGRIVIHVYCENGKPVSSYELNSGVDAANARCAGIAEISFVPVEKETDFIVEAVLLDTDGRFINGEYIRVKVYPGKKTSKVYPAEAFGQKAKEFWVNWE